MTVPPPISRPIAKPPLSPATSRGEATRSRIVAAAQDEFGEKGFHQASVGSITQRAGVGQGTFYLYFRTKDEVFAAVVGATGHALRRHLRLAVKDAADRLDAERRGMHAFFEFVCRHPGLYRVVQEAQFVNETAYRDCYLRLMQGYAADLDAAATRGELSPGDAQTRAWALMGASHFLGMRYCMWTGEPPPDETVDALMDLISRGIAPR